MKKAVTFALALTISCALGSYACLAGQGGVEKVEDCKIIGMTFVSTVKIKKGSCKTIEIRGNYFSPGKKNHGLELSDSK